MTMNIKNITRLFYFLVVVSIGFTSCEDEINKEDYEITDAGQLPALTVTVGDVTYSSATASATLTTNGDTEFSEKGFMVSSGESFLSPESIVVIEDDAAFSTALSGLTGLTKYYVKAYAISVNGVATSEVVSFTTLKAPEFEDKYLYGTYTETDYLLDGSIDGVYTGAVEFVEKPGSADQFYITNLWDGGETITASVDFDTKTISIPAQVVWVSSSSGNFYIYNLEIAGGVVTAFNTGPVTATYDVQGNVTMGPWVPAISTGGNYGQYIKSAFTKTE
jgi:hypothetical protein